MSGTPVSHFKAARSAFYKAHSKRFNFLTDYENCYTPTILQCRQCQVSLGYTPKNWSGRCYICTDYGHWNEERYIKYLSYWEYGTRYVSGFKSLSVRCKHICQCGLNWMARPTDVKFGRTCGVCAGNQPMSRNSYRQRIKEVHDGWIGLQASTPIAFSSKDFIPHRCLYCKFRWNDRPLRILAGYGCPECSDSKNGVSGLSVQWMKSIMQAQGIHIQHGGNGRERRLLLADGKNYKVDGYCEKTNTVYEFHGGYWHGDPREFNQEDTHPSMPGMTFGDAYRRTLAKEKLIRKSGYALVVIWERDYLSSL